MGMVKTMAPIMYLAFVNAIYQVVSKVEEIIGNLKPKLNAGIVEHDVYVLVYFSSNLVPERKNGKMVYVV